MIEAPPSLQFFCRGIPVTKGSLRSWHRRVDGRCIVGISEQNKDRLDEWRALVATAARNAMKDRGRFDGPIEVTLHFYFPRPKTKRVGRYVWGGRRHDIEKLVRAIHDAIGDAGNVWEDDSQVARLVAEKCYVQGDREPGVACLVAETLVR